ncbi:MAG: BPL-N domain-containing protein [Pseudonocardiaceae bacterium]
MMEPPSSEIPGVGVRRLRPVAAVYSDDFTGPADGDDTAAVSAMLASAAAWHFDVITVGPNGTMSVPEALAHPEVQLYAQPGADGDDDAAYRRQKRDKSAIKQFVREGGRYLGICMGGFLAEPGHFNVFPGRVDEYYSSRGASVTTADAAVIPVIWRGTTRAMYFQDGGYMVPRRKATGITVLGRYTNGTIAALVSRYGQGKVGLCGPHPEAPPQWYREGNLTYGGPTQDLGDDLIDTLMAP